MENSEEMPGRGDFLKRYPVTEMKTPSLQEKTGASAEDIRKAIEKLGFDRSKVEEYLVNRIK